MLPAVSFALMMEDVLVDGHVYRVRFRNWHREMLLDCHRVRSLDNIGYLYNLNVSISSVRLHVCMMGSGTGNIPLKFLQLQL